MTKQEEFCRTYPEHSDRLRAEPVRGWKQYRPVSRPVLRVHIFSYLGRICVGTCFDKSLYNLEVSSLECQSERGAPLCVFDVQVGTCLGQGSSNLNVTVQSRPRQSCPPGITPRIYIGSGVKSAQAQNRYRFVQPHSPTVSCRARLWHSRLLLVWPARAAVSGENRPHSKQPT